MLQRLSEAGIHAGLSIAPVLPGLSVRPEQLETVVKAARDHGARFIWCGALRLSPGTREHFLECLSRDWPELLPWYGTLYDRPSAPRWITQSIDSMAAALKAKYSIDDEGALRAPASEEQLPLFAAS